MALALTDLQLSGGRHVRTTGRVCLSTRHENAWCKPSSGNSSLQVLSTIHLRKHLSVSSGVFEDEYDFTTRPGTSKRKLGLGTASGGGGQVDGLPAGMMNTNSALEGKKNKNHGLVRNVIQAAVFCFTPFYWASPWNCCSTQHEENQRILLMIDGATSSDFC